MLEILSGPDFPALETYGWGCRVESKEYLARIDVLRRVPARVRFISFEPLLGPIIAPDLKGIHWAIVGGESGPGARRMEPWWVEQLHDACERQRIAFFFKQWGGPRKNSGAEGYLRIAHGMTTRTSRLDRSGCCFAKSAISQSTKRPLAGVCFECLAGTRRASRIAQRHAEIFASSSIGSRST